MLLGPATTYLDTYNLTSKAIQNLTAKQKLQSRVEENWLGGSINAKIQVSIAAVMIIHIVPETMPLLSHDLQLDFLCSCDKSSFIVNVFLHSQRRKITLLLLVDILQTSWRSWPGVYKY